MARRTKKQIAATKVGAVIVLIGLLLAFGTVAAVDLAYADAAADAEAGAAAREVVWSIEEAADIDTPNQLQQFCGPVLFFPFTYAVDVNASVGSGLAVNTSTPQANRVCAPVTDNSENIVFHLNLLAGDVAGLGARYIEIGWTTDDPQTPNRTLDMRMGVVSAAVPDFISPIICPECPLDVVVTEGQPNRIPLTAGIISFLETFPAYEVAFRMSGDHTVFPDLLTAWNLDVTFYGAEGTTGNVSTDLFASFGVDQVLGSMYYGVAFLAVIGSAMLWPTTTWGGIVKTCRRSKR